MKTIIFKTEPVNARAKLAALEAEAETLYKV